MSIEKLKTESDLKTQFEIRAARGKCKAGRGMELLAKAKDEAIAQGASEGFKNPLTNPAKP